MDEERKRRMNEGIHLGEERPKARDERGKERRRAQRGRASDAKRDNSRAALLSLVARLAFEPLRTPGGRVCACADPRAQPWRCRRRMVRRPPSMQLRRRSSSTPIPALVLVAILHSLSATSHPASVFAIDVLLPPDLRFCVALGVQSSLRSGFLSFFRSRLS